MKVASATEGLFQEELDDAVWGQRAEFSERMMEFTKGFDLIGRGRVDRKVEAKDELRRLTHMEKVLEEGKLCYLTMSWLLLLLAL